MARFVEISEGHFINVDQVTDYIKYDDHIDARMSDGQSWRVPARSMKFFMGWYDVKNLVYVPNMTIMVLDEKTGEETEEPAEFVAVMEDGSIRIVDPGDLSVDFIDDGRNFNGMKINGHDTYWSCR